MDENNFVRSFFVNGEDTNHHHSHHHRTRTDSLFGDNDLFAGYALDPLVDVKGEHGSFEPLDPSTFPMTPNKTLIDFSTSTYPPFPTQPTHEFELRVPQLATGNYDYSYMSSMPHQSMPTYQQPGIMPTPSAYLDPMLRANTTISTSPAIEVRKFPVDNFRKYQDTNQIMPLHTRSISDSTPYNKHPLPMTLKVPVQRSTTVPTTARDHGQAEPTYKSKGKRCTENGCTRRAQSNNRCKAHGGGARCQHPGCPKSSQGGGFCRAHGGGKKCEFEGCTKGQQRKGFCYAHGGIRKCKAAMCDKKDRGNGFCIAHGGGKRCSMDGCLNAVRKGKYCRAHMSAAEE